MPQNPGVDVSGRQSHPLKASWHLAPPAPSPRPLQPLFWHDWAVPHSKPGVSVLGRHLQPLKALVQVASPSAKAPSQSLSSHDFSSPHSKPGVLALGVQVQPSKSPPRQVAFPSVTSPEQSSQDWFVGQAGLEVVEGGTEVVVVTTVEVLAILVEVAPPHVQLSHLPWQTPSAALQSESHGRIDNGGHNRGVSSEGVQPQPMTPAAKHCGPGEGAGDGAILPLQD